MQLNNSSSSNGVVGKQTFAANNNKPQSRMMMMMMFDDDLESEYRKDDAIANNDYNNNIRSDNHSTKRRQIRSNSANNSNININKQSIGLNRELAQNSDVLVRLVGRSHAKNALQYFSCYLMSSSITILLCLWLSRLLWARSIRRRYKKAQFNFNYLKNHRYYTARHRQLALEALASLKGNFSVTKQGG